MKTLVLSRCLNVKAGAIKSIANFENIEKIDLTGCSAVDDESLLPLCETDKVKKLKFLSLCDCARVTDTGLTWLSNGRSTLVMLSLKGTLVTRHACRAVRSYFPYSDAVYNQNFVGFWPKPLIDERLLIREFERMEAGLNKIQGKARVARAKKIRDQLIKEKEVNHAILYIQRLARVIVGKNILKRKRLELAKRMRAACVITSLFRMIIARNLANRLRAKRRALLKNVATRKIQFRWMIYLNFKQMKVTQANYKRLLDRRYKSATKIQSVARVYFARKRVRVLREYEQFKKRLREKKALHIQRIYRGHVDRRTVRMLREQIEYERRTRHEQATRIQRAFRHSRTRLAVRRAHELRMVRHANATRIQALVRGKLARWEMLATLNEIHGMQRDTAAMKLQTAWRRKKAYIEAAKLRHLLALELERRLAAALVITHNAKMWSAKCLLARLKAEHEELVRQEVLLEIQSATKIQAVYRGMLGRQRFKLELRRKKGQWKELFDEDKQMRFFYNKLTGEIRWRMPQDLLDLIPRPYCDNCEYCEATVECEHCNEVFCPDCWNTIHYSGRRRQHQFRCLYDYYGKRIDYGDGEFPSKWPTEVMQDEIQGWMLRVAPIRDPVEILGNWERYEEVDATDGVEPTVLSTFYFNRQTFETTYELPPELPPPPSEEWYGYDESTGAGYATYDSEGYEQGAYVQTDDTRPQLSDEESVGSGHGGGRRANGAISSSNNINRTLFSTTRSNQSNNSNQMFASDGGKPSAVGGKNNTTIRNKASNATNAMYASGGSNMFSSGGGTSRRDALAMSSSQDLSLPNLPYANPRPTSKTVGKETSSWQQDYQPLRVDVTGLDTPDGLSTERSGATRSDVH